VIQLPHDEHATQQSGHGRKLLHSFSVFSLLFFILAANYIYNVFFFLVAAAIYVHMSSLSTRDIFFIKTAVND
jgi:hypothetical protein